MNLKSLFILWGRKNERFKNTGKQRFSSFFELVQRKAAETGEIFYGFCGEGNEFYLETMEGEELSGWLIPMEKSEFFEKEWRQSKSLDDLEQWMDYYTWVLWKNHEGRIEIEFKQF